jgi:hypothetical protein
MEYIYTVIFIIIFAGALYYLSLLFNKFNFLTDNKIHQKYCPLCGTKLHPTDTVLAEIINNSPPFKAYIKGCKYCYLINPNIEEKEIFFDGRSTISKRQVEKSKIIRNKLNST